MVQCGVPDQSLSLTQEDPDQPLELFFCVWHHERSVLSSRVLPPSLSTKLVPIAKHDDATATMVSPAFLRSRSIFPQPLSRSLHRPLTSRTVNIT